MATDNMSIDLTVDEDWRLQPVRSVNRDRQEATACDLKAKFAEALTKHGGVEQYLRLRFLETPGAACAFTDWLLQIFPLDANVLYDTSVRLETSDPQHLDMGRPLTLHPASFGWGPGCAVKGPTESSVALELCEHILADGFDCNNNRLLVTQPADLVAQREDLSDCVTSESRSACPACAGAESTPGPAQYEPSYRFAGLLQGQGASIRPAGAAGSCPSARIC